MSRLWPRSLDRRPRRRSSWSRSWARAAWLCRQTATLRRPRICDRAGALLIIDEVQSGIGRTGQWFAVVAQGVVPDIITLAKGLAGGMPLGACLGLGAARRACSARRSRFDLRRQPGVGAPPRWRLDTIAERDLLNLCASRCAPAQRSGWHLITRSLLDIADWACGSGLLLADACGTCRRVRLRARATASWSTRSRPDARSGWRRRCDTGRLEQADAFLDRLPEILDQAAGAKPDRSADQGRQRLGSSDCCSVSDSLPSRTGELLSAEGIEVTQATVSRDLDELGAVQGPAQRG